jgi:hypothetical protein
MLVRPKMLDLGSLGQHLGLVWLPDPWCLGVVWALELNVVARPKAIGFGMVARPKYLRSDA